MQRKLPKKHVGRGLRRLAVFVLYGLDQTMRESIKMQLEGRMPAERPHNSASKE